MSTVVDTPQGIHRLRSYRAHLLPLHCDLADPHSLADESLLPTIRVKAVTATQAEAVADLATGKKVLRVERVDD